MRLRALLTLSIVAASAVYSSSQAQSLTPGNLVVTRVGDGVAAPTNAANPVFVDQYTTSGTYVNTITIPTTASGANLPCTNSGTATSELSLNLSGDRRYLTFGGYDATVGTTGVASSTVPRVCARVAMDGSVDTSTQLGTLYSGNNLRSVWTSNGTDFWCVGATSGIVYSPLGGAGALVVCNTTTNNRVINSNGTDIYYMTGAGTRGFYKIPGFPTTSGQTSTNQFPTGTSSSPYDFIMVDANDIYIADDAAGLQKWVNTGGTWSVAYTMTAGAAFVRSLAYDGTNIYAVTTDDRIVVTQDTGSGFNSFATIATAGTNTHLRGIKYLPAGSQQTVHASGVTVTSGTLVSGGLSQLQDADGQYLVAKPSLLNHGFIVAGPVQVVVTGTAPTGTASALKFNGISHASRLGVGQTIELYDYQAGAYVAVDTRALSTSDQTVEINASNPARFVNRTTHEVRARLTYNPMATVNSLNWSISIDQTVWTITP